MLSPGGIPLPAGAGVAKYTEKMTLRSMQAPHTSATYRLQGIPYHLTEPKVRRIVKSALRLPDHVQVRVHSLANSPYNYHLKEKIATISFTSTPEIFTCKETEWKVEHIDDESNNDKLISLVFDTHFRGLTPLHGSDDAECDTDLIAVSGLGGHAFGSFKERAGPFMWLRDGLPHDLPGVRIFIYGYDSTLAKSDSFQTILDLGNQFESSIRAIRDDQHSELCKTRPLLLIGHSLGGLLLKQMIILMSRENYPRPLDLETIHGILFFGVPSQGMDIESLIPIVGLDQPNLSLLGSLNKTSSALRDQQREFRRAFRHKGSEIVSFYETKQSPTAIKLTNGQWKMDGPLATLVDTFSATQHRWQDDKDVPINRSHSDMVKFVSRHDENYILARENLSRLRKAAQSGKGARLIGKDAGIAYNPSSMQKACLRSLAFDEIESRWHKILTVNDGSCDWLFRHEAYDTWLRKKQGLLWIRGKPGAGKSTLMKSAVTKYKSQVVANEIVISFFFNARGTEIEKSPLGMFRSLLHQLLVLPWCHEWLEKLSSKFENKCEFVGPYGVKWSWTKDELREFLSEIIIAVSAKVAMLIFVDALDESGESNADEIVRWLKTLVVQGRSRQVLLQICFSCRPYPIISWREPNDGTSICVEEENHSALSAYTLTELGRGFGEAQSRELSEGILFKAAGVFQWVALVLQRLEVLRRKGKSFKTIWKSLQEIPKDLHQLYEELLQRMDDEDRNQCVKLFQWICFARRPLEVRELQHAMMMDIENKYDCMSNYQDDDEFTDSEEGMKSRIIDLSKGLAEVKKDAENGKTVQLIHQSVKDYLMMTGFAALSAITQGSTAICTGHYRLSRSCLRYLSLKDRHQWFGPDVTTTYKKYPLLRYAVEFWVEHAKVVEDHKVCQDDILVMLGPEADDVSTCLTRIRVIMESNYAWKEQTTTLLHVASQNGLTSLARASLKEDCVRAKIRDGAGSLPLHIAARAGHTEIITLLLKFDSNMINEKDGSGQTPIYSAALRGDRHVVESLLHYSEVEVNETDEYSRTPLHLAVLRGHSDIVKILLQHPKIEVNRRDDAGDTPLHLASYIGERDNVNFLLQHENINVNELNNRGQAPLHYAVFSGRSDIVRLLLKLDNTKVNDMDYRGRTPLDAAMYLSHTKIANLLNKTGGRYASPPGAEHHFTLFEFENAEAEDTDEDK